MVPILDVMYEPILPAMIIDTNVGENSKIIDCLAVKPIKYLGIIGLFKFKAVCMVTTAPMKNDKKATIPNEPMINSSTSLKIRFFMIRHFVGRLKISPNIMKYFPMLLNIFIITHF